MAIHSSILAWRIPCTEESGGLQSKGVAKSRTWLSMHANFLRQIYWSKVSSSLGPCLRGPSSKEQLLRIHKAGKNERIWRQLVPPFCLRHDWSDLAEKAEREKAYHHHQVVKFPAGYWISYFLSGLEQEGMGREEETSSSVPASKGNECLSWPPGWYDGEKRKVPRHSFPTTTWFGWHLSSHKSSWLKIYTS